MGDHAVDIIDQPSRADELIAEGGEVVRHFWRMSLDLSSAGLPTPKSSACFTLHPVSLDHLSAYAEIIVRCYAGDHVDHEPEDDDPEAAAQVIQDYLTAEEPSALHPAASTHVARDDGKIVGLVIVTGDMPWILELAVDPSFRGNGLATLMLAKAAEELAAAGHAELGLSVTVGNPAAVLYERIGFRASAEVWRIRLATNEDPKRHVV